MKFKIQMTHPGREQQANKTAIWTGQGILALLSTVETARRPRSFRRIVSAAQNRHNVGDCVLVDARDDPHADRWQNAKSCLLVEQLATARHVLETTM